MADRIVSVETFLVQPKNTSPYLSGSAPTPELEARGYLVSPVNRTIYPHDFKSLLVKVTTADGVIGWGETYGICAPLAVAELLRDIIGPYVTGRDPLAAQVLWDELYDLMRVRNNKGFYCDALAALDIALGDIVGKTLGRSLAVLIGGKRRETIPAYVSGLVAPSIEEKVAAAREWVSKGFKAIKLHATHTSDLDAELSALRGALGNDVELVVDLHWEHSFTDAARLIEKLARYDIAFAEAPVKPEDVRGMVALSQRTATPLAAGEEWRTVHDALPYLAGDALRILQPEMGHTGITQFMRIAALADAFNARIAPHATIGAGIFLAASLHASSVIGNLRRHEYHPAIFDRSRQLLDGDIACQEGAYTLPSGPGLGVEPNEELLANATPI